MSAKLTSKHLHAYLVKTEACPFCGAEELKARGSSFVDAICSRDIECLSCKEEFTEEFIMVGISQNDDVLIIPQDSFLDDVESIYYDLSNLTIWISKY